MTNNNIKRMILLVLLTLLLIGIANAAEVNDGTYTSINKQTEPEIESAQNVQQYNDLESNTKEIRKQNTNTTQKSYNTKTNTKITINKVSQKTYKDEVTVTGKFTDKNGKILKNTLLEVRINGNSYNAKTNNNGVYTKKFTANKVGTNNIIVSYIGNDNYQATSNKTTFATVKLGTKLTINPISTTQNGNIVKITGTFTDKKGNTLKNTIIKLNINGKTYQAKTNINGVYTYNYKTTKAGTNKVTVSYGGNVNYIKTSAQRSFTVLAIKSVTLPLSNKQVGYKSINGDPFCAHYTTTYGQYDPGVYVEIDERGLSYSPVNKLIKAKFFFKNSYGKIITRTVNAQYYTGVETSLISGYRPYKVDVYYRQMTETERYNYWYGY